MMFEIADEEPSEKTSPMKSEMPLKAGDSDPGMYGIGDDEGEHDHRHPHQLEGRRRPIRIEPLELHLAARHAVEEEADEIERPAGEDVEDDRGRADSG